MASNIIYNGTPLNSYFQLYNSGNVSSGYTPVTTNINIANSDINTILSPRDNNTSNAATSTGAIISNSKDLVLLFNKTGATYNVIVGGSVPYTGSIITTGITFSGQNPTANGASAPTFTVPTPIVNTSSTNCIAVGNYTFLGGSLTSSSIIGGSLKITLPGNYQIGTISGTFTIVSVTATIQQAKNSARIYTCTVSVTGITLLEVTSYIWVIISGTACTFSSNSTSTSNPVTVNETGTSTTTTTIQCTINYTGGGGSGNIKTQQSVITWG